MLQCLHKALPSTTLYYKACTKYFPVVLCTTKLAQSTSHYYFVLQSLHKVLPSTTLYYKACTKYFTVLLCTRKLAQSMSQYSIVLQNLRNRVKICASKTGSRRRSRKKQNFETLFKRNFKRKTTSATLHGKNTTHAAITMRFAAPRTHPCSRYNNNAIRIHALQNTKGEPITHDYALKPSRPHPPHTGGTFHRRLRPPLHRKTHCFVLRLPPQNKPHATFMQPSQCAWQHHVANAYLYTHMATKRNTNHAAIPLRSATKTSKTPYHYAHTNNH